MAHSLLICYLWLKTIVSKIPGFMQTVDQQLQFVKGSNVIPIETTVPYNRYTVTLAHSDCFKEIKIYNE